ncbi:nickel pincer cofactor biosynthesis protein LarC [Microlunatus spumicola]|uniref:Pyridinium-3,5-bisthiocarboxylic acid mononucleotide nickel insertion protein n=1 Tax=Microlunatus spumicola TaxID=81499 RepID=A0ABP6WYG1_9ACTN
MRHLWVDASAGVAGDMLLGALLDAGASLVAVQRAVDAVVAGSVTVEVQPVTRAGMRATKADVVMRVDDPPHRDWRTIHRMLAEADLDERVRLDATRVFAALADAEARAHGIDAEDVHFHEVGALDSIADVVGVCAAVADLGVQTLSAGEVAVGSGTVRMAHGRIAVPGPAVVELSRGWRVRAGGEGELTTPTGMALVTTLGDACEDLPSMTVEGSGTGAGTRDVAGRPNVTRVFLGEREAATATASEGTPAVVVEANVDDLDPRLWPGVLTALMAAGAQDAWLVPVLMKKGRPAHTLHVLCAPDDAARLRDVVFAQTSTIGVRQAPTTKFMLPRVWVDVQVDDHAVPVKISHAGGVIITATPEFDVVAALARTTDRPEVAVMAAAVTAAAAAGLVPGAPLPPA